MNDAAPMMHTPLQFSTPEDFNGDGLGDFVTGAPGSDSGIGRAYVIYGKGNGSNILPISDVSILTEPDDSYAGLVLGGTAGGTYSNNIGYAVAGAG